MPRSLIVHRALDTRQAAVAPDSAPTRRRGTRVRAREPEPAIRPWTTLLSVLLGLGVALGSSGCDARLDRALPARWQLDPQPGAPPAGAAATMGSTAPARGEAARSRPPGPALEPQSPYPMGATAPGPPLER